MNTPSIWFTNPDVIWSGVIASVLALSGVILTVWINSINISRQLLHDAQERDKERKSDMRRQVYLAAAEELANAQNYLSTLPQANLSDPQQAVKMNGFYAAAAKVQLVCEPDTALLIGELVGKFGGLTLRLLGAVAPLHQVQSDIDIRTHHYNRYTAEIDRILAAMSALNESGNPDPDKMQILQKSFDFNQEQARKISDERNALFDKRNAMHADYSKMLLMENKKILHLQIDVMASIRMELNLHSDPTEARLQAEKQTKQMEIQMDSLLLQLKNTTES